MDALNIWPPLWLSSVLGLPWTRWPSHPYSEYNIGNPLYPARLLEYLADVNIPSIPAKPPFFLPPRLQRLFWHPSTVQQRGDQNESETSYLNEKWFFLNGIMTNEALAQINAAHLAYLFHRPISLLENSTDGFFEDLLECAQDKAWLSLKEAARVAFPPIYDALRDTKRTRVVLIAHSQGTIIAGALLVFMKTLLPPPRIEAFAEVQVLPDDFPLSRCDFPMLLPEEVAKLEVYCFATAGSVEYVCEHEGRLVPWLEHFGNEHDIVARLGMLAPNQDKHGIVVQGPRYVRRGAWGHWLDDHYLRPIELVQKQGRRLPGPRPHTQAAPFRLDDSGGVDPEKAKVPRLYQYLNGGTPDAPARPSPCQRLEQ